MDRSMFGNGKLPATGVRRVAFCLLLFAVASGCKNGVWFAAPGTINSQRADAVVHDPYPSTRIAPDDAAARPPGYEQPLPEPVRNRLMRDSMPWANR